MNHSCKIVCRVKYTSALVNSEGLKLVVNFGCVHWVKFEFVFVLFCLFLITFFLLLNRNISNIQKWSIVLTLYVVVLKEQIIRISDKFLVKFKHVFSWILLFKLFFIFIFLKKAKTFYLNEEVNYDSTLKPHRKDILFIAKSYVFNFALKRNWNHPGYRSSQ